MRKVIKISLSLLSSLILGILILPLAASLLLSIPTVQNMAVRFAARWASDALGTTVSIDRISIRSFSKVMVRGFYVEGFDRDTLLYVGRLDANLSDMGFLRGNIGLGRVTLEDPVLNIKRYADSTTNIKLVIEKLKPEVPRNNVVRIRMGNLSINNMSFYFKRLDMNRDTPGVDFTDLGIRNLNLSANTVRLVNDDIKMALNNLSFKEKSGFEVFGINGETLALSPKGIALESGRLHADRTELNIVRYAMIYDDWRDMGDFVNRVELEADVIFSKIDLSTVGWFVPAVYGRRMEVDSFSARLCGPVRNMSGIISRAATGETTSLSGDFTITGLPDIQNTVFDVDLERFHTNAADIDHILQSVTSTELGDSVLRRLANLQDIYISGGFNGTVRNFSSVARVQSARGDADFDLSFFPAAGGNTGYSGRVGVAGFDLGGVLNFDLLGRISVSAVLNGVLDPQGFSLDAQGEVQHLAFNGYDYENIDIRGHFDNRYFEGYIGSSDPNIDFDFNGVLDFNNTIPRYDFDLQLRRADLVALNFNRRDSLSVVDARLKAVASGRSADDLNGFIEIADLHYKNHIDSVYTSSIRFTGRNTQDSKYLSMNSVFADIEFCSRTPYAQLVDYFTGTVRSYVSFDDGQREHQETDRLAAPSDYSLLTVNVKQANNTAGIFVPGLMIASGTNITFMFNPGIEKFSLAVKSDWIERGNFFVEKLDLTSQNQGDSIALYVRADELYAGGFRMPMFSVIGGAKDNRLYAATRFVDNLRNSSALIGTETTFSRNEVTGTRHTVTRFTPSYFTLEGKSWNVYGRDIEYDTTRLSIGNFVVEGDGQLLRIYGDAGKSESDTVHLDMRDFDLAVLTRFTDRMGYDIKGRTSGHADIISALGEGILHADISLDSLRLNDEPIPSALFTSMWEFQQSRALFQLVTREKGDTVLRGFYMPSERRYLGDVVMKGVDLSLLSPFFDGILTDTEGAADVTARVTGTRHDLKVNGRAEIPEIVTRVDFLNVPYTLRGGVVTVRDNVMRLEPNRVYDPTGNSAAIDLAVDMTDIRNIRYDININPENLMVLNTTMEMNDMFYGRVFGTGAATISGGPRGIDMNINATTTGASEFYMPLTGKSDVGMMDFVTFITPRTDMVADSSDYLVRKRMILNRRRDRNRADRGWANMNIHMVAEVTPAVDFQLLIDPKVGDIIRGRGRGTLTMALNPTTGDFSMNGDYEISDGSYMFTLGQGIIARKFDIEPGSAIQWTGDPLDATLDINAVYRLKTSLAPLKDELGLESAYLPRIPVECHIMLSEKLTQPLVEFDIVLPNDSETQGRLENALNTQEAMATQFFFLIAARSFSPISGAGVGNIGVTGTQNTVIELLTNQLNNWISSERFDFGLHYTMGDNQLTSDEVNLDLSYRLHNRILLELEGSYDTGNTPNMNGSVNNLTGDFYITWLIDQAGDLRAKGFTRTIDRFDENQGLQESGLGIYYKEDFNNVIDIVRNFRDCFRFRKLRRRDRQEERQERLQAEEADAEEASELFPTTF